MKNIYIFLLTLLIPYLSQADVINANCNSSECFDKSINNLERYMSDICLKITKQRAERVVDDQILKSCKEGKEKGHTIYFKKNFNGEEIVNPWQMTDTHYDTKVPYYYCTNSAGHKAYRKQEVKKISDQQQLCHRQASDAYRTANPHRPRTQIPPQVESEPRKERTYSCRVYGGVRALLTAKQIQQRVADGNGATLEQLDCKGYNHNSP